MPTDIHPLLRPKEEVIEEPAAETPVEETAVEAPVPETPAAETEPAKRFIDLDSPDLYREIQKWQNEDPRFSNVVNSLVGRKAQQTYQPQITKAQADLARAQQRVRELELTGMSEDDVKQKLLENAEFRQSYGQQPERPEVIELRGSIQAAIARVEDSVSLPPETIAAYQQRLYAGAYDHQRDESGRAVRQLSPQETIAWYSTALHAEANRRPIPAPPPPAPQPKAVVEQVPEPQPAKPPVNTRLAQLNVDLSPGNPSGGQTSYKLSEIRRMNPIDRLAAFPDGAALQRAIENGTVQVDV